MRLGSVVCWLFERLSKLSVVLVIGYRTFGRVVYYNNY